jgi:aminotransferase
MNPTGTVFSKKTLEAIADFAVENDILIISDEAYEKLVYTDARHVSIGSLNGMHDHVVTLQTFSKSYAMPGFRVGYAAGPEKIIAAMTKLHIFSSIAAPSVSQMAALEALTGPQNAVQKMVKEYDRRRKMMFKRLQSIPNFFVSEPKGAFYTFPNIKEFGLDSLTFAEQLLKKGQVAVVPGTEFGMNGEGFIRLSYATAYEKIEKGLNRVERFVSKL